jgi:hypothetical protein
MFTGFASGKKASAGMAASMLACAMGFAQIASAEPAYSVGARTTVLGDKGAGGLSQFPETPVTVLQSAPEYHVLIASGLKTYYCKGPSMDKLMASPTAALSPSGAKGYDEVSAHITSTWTEPGTGDVYAVFNANDSDQVPRIPGPGIGFRGRYFTAGLAKSTNGGQTFTKIGPILSIPKNATVDPLQGDAYGAVVMSPDKQWLYLYYGDMYNAMKNGGVQTCVARASVASHGLPGSWKKWYDGDWKTEGIVTIDTTYYTGAETTPVVINTVSLYGDAMYPSVKYSAKLGAYVMVYAVNVFDEIPAADSLGQFPPAELSGIYIAYSKDGITWAGHHQLVKAISIDYPGREVALHPSLEIDENASSATELKGTLFYGYNKNMWLGTPATQYLVSHTVDISGITPELYTSKLIAPMQGRRAPGFSILPGAAGQWLLHFANDVDGIKLVNAKGAAAGKALRVGVGRYQVQAASKSGPLFLQGKQAGNAFTSILNLP